MHDSHYSRQTHGSLQRNIMFSLRFSFILIIILLSSCQPPSSPVYKTQIPIFGTLVEVSIKGTTPTAAQQAFTELQALFQQLHTDWHPWLDGELDRLNSAIATGQTYTISTQLADLLNKAQRAEHESLSLIHI